MGDEYDDGGDDFHNDEDVGDDYDDDDENEEEVEGEVGVEGEEGEVLLEEDDELGSDIEPDEELSKGDIESDVADVQRILDRRKKMLDTSSKIVNRLTKYELTAIIGYRAQQIAEGAQPYVKVQEGTDPITIAIDEFNHNLIPLVIERPFPTNKIGRFKYETFKLDELLNVMQIK